MQSDVVRNASCNDFMQPFGNWFHDLHGQNPNAAHGCKSRQSAGAVTTSDWMKDLVSWIESPQSLLQETPVVFPKIFELFLWH